MPNTRPASLTGYASNWGPSFASQTDSTPAVGSIAWWDTSYSSTGHVAYVEKVISNDEVIVSEDNWGGDLPLAPGDPLGRALAHRLHPPATTRARPRPRARPGPAASSRSRRRCDSWTPAPASACPPSASLRAESTCRSRSPDERVCRRPGSGAVVLNVTAFGAVDAGLGHGLCLRGRPCPTCAARRTSAAYYSNTEVVVRVGADGRVKLRPSSHRRPHRRRRRLAADLLVAHDDDSHPHRRHPRAGWVRRRARCRRWDASTSRWLVAAAYPRREQWRRSSASRLPKPPASGSVAAWATGDDEARASPTSSSGQHRSTGLVTSLVGQLRPGESLLDASTDLVVDVVGWVPADSDVRVLRPARLLDTRSRRHRWLPARRGESLSRGAGGVPRVRRGRRARARSRASARRAGCRSSA